MKDTRSTTLQDAADLIERRLVKTSSCAGRQLDTLNDYQRGIMYALRECQALLRQEASA